MLILLPVEIMNNNRLQRHFNSNSNNDVLSRFWRCSAAALCFAGRPAAAAAVGTKINRKPVRVVVRHATRRRRLFFFFFSCTFSLHKNYYIIIFYTADSFCEFFLIFYPDQNRFGRLVMSAGIVVVAWATIPLRAARWRAAKWFLDIFVPPGRCSLIFPDDRKLNADEICLLKKYLPIYRLFRF